MWSPLISIDPVFSLYYPKWKRDSHPRPIKSYIAKYGIVIEQDYENGSPTGVPTAGVPITGLTVSKVTGSVKSSGTDVLILCAKGACSNWTWSGVSVTGGKKSTKCLNIPSGSGASC